MMNWVRYLAFIPLLMFFGVIILCVIPIAIVAILVIVMFMLINLCRRGK